MRRKCDICGRLFEVTEYEALCEQYSRVSIRVQRAGYLMDQHNFDTCEHCARRVLHYMFERKRLAPKKCIWCEHDVGPKHPDYKKDCVDCSDYSNFQLKKIMSPDLQAGWKLYFEEEAK